MSRIPAWDLPYLQLVLPLFVAPPVSDDPLTPDELAALSRAGWGLLGTRTTAAGIVLVCMVRHTEDGDVIEEYTPGGWRMLL